MIRAHLRTRRKKAKTIELNLYEGNGCNGNEVSTLILYKVLGEREYQTSIQCKHKMSDRE